MPQPLPTVAALLRRVPAEARGPLQDVLDVLRRHMPAGYEEATVKDTIVFQVPLTRYSDTYNGHPLWYAALAAHKTYLSLYLMSVYGDARLAARLREGFAAAGRKLDMGKSCVHFKRAADLPLDVIGDIVASVPVDRWIAIAKAARRERSSRARG